MATVTATADARADRTDFVPYRLTVPWFLTVVDVGRAAGCAT